MNKILNISPRPEKPTVHPGQVWKHTAGTSWLVVQVMPSNGHHIEPEYALVSLQSGVARRTGTRNINNVFGSDRSKFVLLEEGTTLELSVNLTKD